MPSPLQHSGLVIAAGTYDGVLAGWQWMESQQLDLTFATSVHTGSIRSLCMASSNQEQRPGTLLSCGYDETLRTHDWHKQITSSGEIRTPTDFGTPTCSAFTPPMSTHCLIGFSNGKLCIYKKRDWSVQHVLAGHDAGVSTLAVHPTGKLAFSGGNGDGKLKLWDLTKGRLAFVNKINPKTSYGNTTRYDTIESIVWSNDGEMYAVAYGSHITVRHVATGKELLDVDVPSRVHQVTFMTGPEGVFIAAACNDGSLPVLAVEDSEEESRRGIMAIEPVDSHLAGEERFKCIQCVKDYYVVTANSAGVISVMDLSGAVHIIMTGDDETDNDNSDDTTTDKQDENSSRDTSVSSDEDSQGETELAVDILASTRLGTGARITCLSAWCRLADEMDDDPVHDDESSPPVEESKEGLRKRKEPPSSSTTMNEEAIEKARSLVEQAKSIKKRKDKQQKKKRKKGMSSN